MIGNVYLLRGEPVMVLARAEWRKGTPRNVLLLRADGAQTVRPFRGLRRLAHASTLGPAHKLDQEDLTVSDEPIDLGGPDPDGDVDDDAAQEPTPKPEAPAEEGPGAV